jgi:protein-L-isoaspartate O-methyltransferase
MSSNPAEAPRRLGQLDLTAARAAMAARLAHAGVSPRVVAAMAEVPRHEFVPDGFWRLAYTETDLWLGDAWLASPSSIARLLDALDVKPTDRVREVGALTGYTTALLGQLCREVVADPPFDAILVHTALASLPSDLLAERAPRGGRLVAAIGPASGPQRLIRAELGEHGTEQLRDLGPIWQPSHTAACADARPQVQTGPEATEP